MVMTARQLCTLTLSSLDVRQREEVVRVVVAESTASVVQSVWWCGRAAAMSWTCALLCELLACSDAALPSLSELQVELDSEETSLSEVGLLCPQLRSLRLQPPRSHLSTLRDLGGHRSFTCLTSLSVVRCGLTDVTGVEGLVRLQLLDVSHNAVDDLSPLHQHPALTSLVATHTALTDEHQVEWLPAAQLLCLDLRHTRAARSSRYPQLLQRLLPHLKHLDGRDLPWLTADTAAPRRQQRRTEAEEHTREAVDSAEDGADAEAPWTPAWPWLHTTTRQPLHAAAEVWTLRDDDDVCAAVVAAARPHAVEDEEGDSEAELAVLDPAQLQPSLKSSLADKGVHASSSRNSTTASSSSAQQSAHSSQASAGSSHPSSSSSPRSSSVVLSSAPCSPARAAVVAAAAPPAPPSLLRPFTTQSLRPSSSNAVMSSSVAISAGLVMAADTEGSSALTFRTPQQPPRTAHGPHAQPQHAPTVWQGSFLTASRQRRRREASDSSLQPAQPSADELLCTAELSSHSPIPHPLPPRSPRSCSTSSNGSLCSPSPPRSPSSPCTPSTPWSASSAHASRLLLSSAPSSSSQSRLCSSPSSDGQAAARSLRSDPTQHHQQRPQERVATISSSSASPRSGPPPSPPAPPAPGCVLFSIDSTASSLSASPRSTSRLHSRHTLAPHSPRSCSPAAAAVQPTASPHLLPLHTKRPSAPLPPPLRGHRQATPAALHPQSGGRASQARARAQEAV